MAERKRRRSEGVGAAKSKKKKKPASFKLSATDSEDVVHDMLAAAASAGACGVARGACFSSVMVLTCRSPVHATRAPSQLFYHFAPGGRFWKKKQRLLDRKEGLRRASATEARAATRKMERRTALALAEGCLALAADVAPLLRDFWKGAASDGGAPGPELKRTRQELGIRVAPGVPGCPPPLLGPTVWKGDGGDGGVCAGVDAALPKVFGEYFATVKGLGLRRAPTAVQRQAWPALLSGRDLLAVSPTGSGKTLAYLLPLVPHVLAQRRPMVGEGPLAVILVPTRELAQQVKQACLPLRKLCGLRCVGLHGGLLRHERQAQVCDLLENVTHIVVATPGRLADLATAGGGDNGDDDGDYSGGEGGKNFPVLPLRRVSFLVLDEADRMLALGEGVPCALVPCGQCAACPSFSLCAPRSP